ncbi:2223_t:CDS:2, partial [Entrophospora sp. SA101]
NEEFAREDQANSNSSMILGCGLVSENAVNPKRAGDYKSSSVM